MAGLTQLDEFVARDLGKIDRLATHSTRNVMRCRFARSRHDLLTCKKGQLSGKYVKVILRI